jgi:hypothetical protein
VDTSVGINVLANDSDPDGDILTISDYETASAQGGTVQCTDVGMCTYTPPAGFSGSDSFVYTASDGSGGTDSATVTVVVNRVNGPPVAVDDSVTALKNTPVDVNVLDNDSDPDGDTLVVSDYQPSSAQGGTVHCTGGGICTYSPPVNFIGRDDFDYTISDGNGGTDTGTVVVMVYPANSPPVAVDDTATTDEGAPVEINVLANDSDPDGDALTVSAYDGTSAKGGAVQCTDAGVCTFGPPVGFTGTDTFAYTVSDGNGGTDSAGVTVTVNQANNPPTGTGVRLNEVLPVPAAVDWDGDGSANERDEWIELYNAGPVAVDIGGWFLGTGLTKAVVYAIPKGTVLQPGAFAVFYRAGTGVVLDDGGDKVHLIDPGGVVVDQVAFGALDADTSYSRDGQGAWHSNWSPSLGVPNLPPGPTLESGQSES